MIQNAWVITSNPSIGKELYPEDRGSKLFQNFVTYQYVRRDITEELNLH
jgi:hypothetical protein